MKKGLLIILAIAMLSIIIGVVIFNLSEKTEKHEERSTINRIAESPCARFENCRTGESIIITSEISILSQTFDSLILNEADEEVGEELYRIIFNCKEIMPNSEEILVIVGKNAISIDGVTYVGNSQQALVDIFVGKWKYFNENSDNEQALNQESIDLAYMLSKDKEFYEFIKSNPIDANYPVSDDGTMQTYMTALLKCEAWNNQIDYTVEKLKAQLTENYYEELQAAVTLWHNYCQEEIYMNRDLYGSDGVIMGSLYTQLFAWVIQEKCQYMATLLWSMEYELTNSISFMEEATGEGEYSELEISPRLFCFEFDSGLEEAVETSLPDSISADKVCEVMRETASRIDDSFGHEFKDHVEGLISLIDKLCDVEIAVSQDEKYCKTIQDNRLRLFATELLHIEYWINVNKEMFKQED